MRKIIWLVGFLGLMAISCVEEQQMNTPSFTDYPVFYAAIEESRVQDTRVYANNQLHVRWDAGDHISIFNKNTCNLEYAFQGQTGDDSGEFRNVPNGSSFSGNPLDYVYAVYPYSESTSISDNGEITLTLPSEQPYRENSFGLGANTMIAVSDDDDLMFKNLCGYLMLKLYGEDVTVTSISLRGNNGEKLAGNCVVSLKQDGVPSAVLANDASTGISITCDVSVRLGGTPESSTVFWFVVPPIAFNNGFQITISGDGGIFEKSTQNAITIERNKLYRMTPIEVNLSKPRSIIYYTSSDGKVITPTVTEGFGATIVSNEYLDGYGVISFDGIVTSIGDEAFVGCSSLA